MSTRNDILMPKLGLTMTEGMLAEWCITPGATLKAGDVMFVVETDKVATEIMAPSDGQLLEVLVEQGETVPVGTVVARWTGVGQATDLFEPEAPVARDQAIERATVQTLPLEKPPTEQRIVATPLARNLAHRANIDLQTVTGTGPRGRIKAGDVRTVLSARNDSKASPEANQPEQTRRPAAPAQSGTPGSLIQTMARRMVQAKQDTPHFYLSTEAEVSELLRLRERLNEGSPAVKLTVNHFIIAAVAHALAQCPWQNRIWQDNRIVAFDTLDVGVAVSTDKGLMAPVLHRLDGSPLDAIAVQANTLIERVRSGQAQRDDMSGGAITISNAGMFNVTYMTPIINPPQSAILGVGSVRQLFRPDAQGQPALHREMGLVLACDHRLHDGTSGLKFLNAVVELLQNPYRLLRTLP